MKPALIVITLSSLEAKNRLFSGRAAAGCAVDTGSGAVVALMAAAIAAATLAAVSPDLTVYERSPGAGRRNR